jgi:hypothetical protein
MGKPVTLELNPDLPSTMYIFDVVFECKIRNVDLLSEDELRMFGTQDTGMDIFNEANTTQMVSANLTIAEMAKHHGRGNHFRYVFAQDTLKIYEFTQHHLTQWATHLGGLSLNNAQVPIEDLMLLDDYCSTVYEQAKFYDQAKLTSLEQRFGRDMNFSSIVDLFSNQEEKQNVFIEKAQSRHRRGYMELFREFQMRNGGRSDMDDLGIRGLND